MKVYVLYYSYYDESEVKGVYTREAMDAELAQYAERGRKRNDRAIESHEKQLAALKVLRKELGQEDRKLQEKQIALQESDKVSQKMLRSERKKLMRQMDKLAMDIRNQEAGLKKMKNMTDEKLADLEMSREHMYFEEFDVLGTE